MWLLLLNSERTIINICFPKVTNPCLVDRTCLVSTRLKSSNEIGVNDLAGSGASQAWFAPLATYYYSIGNNSITWMIWNKFSHL